MLTRTARVALNTFTNYVRFGIALAVFFLLTPYVIRKVGESDFGLWSFSWAVLNCFILLDLGYGTGVVKYVAECKGSNDAERRNRMLSTLAAVYVLLALSATLLIYVFSLFFVRFFSIPPEQHAKALALLWILGARLAILGLPLGMFRGILFGDQRILFVNAVQIVATLGYGLGSWLVLAWGYGLVALAWVNLAGMVVEHLAYLALSYGFLDKLRISFRLVEWRLFKEASSFSIYAFVASVASLVLLRTDPIIVKMFLPLTAVAVYAVALRIAEQAQLFTRQFTYVLSPFIAELKGSGDEDKIRFVLVNCAKFALAPSMVLCVMVLAFAREAIVFWVGPGFAGAAAVLAILMAAMALSIPTVVACDVFTMTGNPKVTARASIVSIVLNLGVSVALVRPLGLLGVAIGSLVATGAVFALMAVLACREFNVRLRDYVRRVVLLTVAPALLQFGVTVAIKWWRPPASLWTIGWEALPGALLYLAVFWQFCVEPSEKRLLAEKLVKWRRRDAVAAGPKAEA